MKLKSLAFAGFLSWILPSVDMDSSMALDSNYSSRLDASNTLIVSKYLQETNDFINLMCACKKFQGRTEMLHFNPISNHKLFKNMQTQHFLKRDDVKNKKDGMHEYIYWFRVGYTEDIYTKSKDCEIFKDVELNAKNLPMSLEIKEGKYKIPDGITTIGTFCFYTIDTKLLTEIIFPATLKEICDGGLANCSCLKSVALPNGFRKIGRGCFMFCFGLTQLSLPITLTEIGDHCFSGCNNLKEIKAPISCIGRLNEVWDDDFSLDLNNSRPIISVIE